MQKHKYYILLFLVVAALSSCVTSRKVNYMQEPDKRIPTYADTLSYEDYHLQKGDRLYVQVYSINDKVSSLFSNGTNNNMLSTMRTGSGTGIDLYSYVVDDEGNINFPTIGKVYVRGLTTREVKQMLEKELAGLSAEESSSMPSLSVEVQIVQRYFSVIGATSSGRFPIQKEKVTIFEALAQARDIADFGDRSKVHIIRENEDSTIVKTFDVRSADIINSEFYYVQPNDVIYVQKIKGQAFGINSAGAAVSVVATTVSFGVFVYALVMRFKNLAENKNNSSSSSQ